MILTTLFKCLISVQLLTLVNSDIENIDLNYANAKQSYDELYQDGLNAYNTDNHHEAVIYFERAIADYRHELEVKAQCWIRCQANLEKLQTVHNAILDGQLNFLHYSIKMKSCSELCKERFIGRRGRVARSIRQRFEEREPYSYIQYSYYKIGEVNKSLNAAFTYAEMHENDTMMQNNIDVLLQKAQQSRRTLKSLEELPHITLYIEGEAAYDNQNYPQCIQSLEESLSLFFIEEEKCHAVCETEHENNQGSYSTTLFNHFKAIIACRQTCRRALTRINSRTSSAHFVPYYFHYLQYCYFQTGNILEAAIAAESYLLLIPNDPVMMTNSYYYKRQPSIAKKQINPRERASKYFKQFAMELTLYKIAQGYAIPQVEPNKDELHADEQHLDAVFKAVEDELKAHQPSRGEVQTPTIAHHLLPKAYRDQGRWRKDESVNKSVLLMEEEQLNGTDRVAFDNIANEDECKQLMQLVHILSNDFNSKLIKERMQQIYDLSKLTDLNIKLAKSGDGYQHNHEDAAHPFTEKETFKGITVSGAVDAIESGKVSVSDVELYVKLSEKARLLTQEYFDLPVRLNFAFTHLVCRHALTEAITDEEHISHPVHSDNCVLDGDGIGTCPKRPPAYTWRDYSALLYLNDDFTGGDFIFADYKRQIQAQLRPKCGRLVSFRSNGIENLHGVLGVRNGTRCALPIWFTLSNKSEDGRDEAEDKLIKIKNQMNAVKEEL